MIILQLTSDQFTDAVESAVKKVLQSSSLVNKNQTNLIGRKELMKLLNVSEPTLITWGQKGKIPEIRIGKAVRYNYDEVKEALTKTQQ